MSFLKKIGQVIAKVLGIAQKVEPTVAGIAEALLPTLAPFIMEADTIFQKVIREVISAEAAFAGQASSGPQKLAAVLENVGPILDTWVLSNFPGAAKLSDVTKSGLINSIVALLNNIEATATGGPVVPL